MKFLKPQLPLVLSLSLIHLLSPLSLFLFYSLSHACRLCVSSDSFPSLSAPLPSASTFTPPLLLRNHMEKGKGWMMYILGWLSDVERDTAVVYHLRDTHTLTPRCHTDKQMGIPAKSEDLTKSLVLFYEGQVIKLLAEVVYLKQLVCWVSCCLS